MRRALLARRATAALLLATLTSLAAGQTSSGAGANVQLPGDLAVDVASICTACKPYAALLLQTRIAMLQLEAAHQETLQQLTQVWGVPALEEQLAKVPAGSAEAERIQAEIARTRELEKTFRDQSAAMLELQVQAAAFEKLLRDCLGRCQPTVPPAGKSAPPAAAGKAVVKPDAAPGVSVIVRPTGGVYVGQTDFLREESFQIDVRIPGPNPPKSITVQIFGPDGKVKDLTLDATGPGSYLSPPMTARGDLEGMVEKYETTVDQGKPYTVSANGGSTTFKVYSTAVKAEIGQNAQVIEEVRQALANIATGAANALNQLQGAPNDADTAALRKKLEDAKAQAEGKLAWLKQYDAQMTHLTSQGFGDHYVVVWQREYLMLLRQNPLATNGQFPDWFGRYANDKVSQQLNVIMKGVYKDLAMEIYALAVGATLDAVLPLTPMFTLLTGKDIYGEQVDLDGMKHAAKGLAVQGAMLGLQVGLTKCMAPVKGKGSSGPELTSAHQAQIRENTAAEIGAIKKAGKESKAAGKANQGEADLAGIAEAQTSAKVRQDFDAYVKAAEDAGVPRETIDRIVQEAEARFDEANQTLTADVALAEGATELIEEIFRLLHPDDMLVTDVDAQILYGSVKSKAAFEAIDKPQVWTPAEAELLTELGFEKSLDHFFELEDPFEFNLKAQENVEHGGVQAIFSDVDLQNIQTALGKELAIVDVPIHPLLQAELKAFFEAKDNAGNFQKEVGQGAADDAAGVPPLPDQKAKSPFEFSPIDIALTDRSAEFIAVRLGALDLTELRNELAQKLEIRAAKAELAKQSALAPGASFEPRQIEVMTPAEIRALTTDQIRTMPPEARAALPLDQLTPAQRVAVREANRALEQAQGLGTGGGGLPPGLWYWPLGQLFAFDNGRFALTGPYWSEWCGDILLDGFELDPTPYDELAAPNASHFQPSLPFEFKVALVTPLDGQPNVFDPKQLEELIKPQLPGPGPGPQPPPPPGPPPPPPPPQQPTATPTTTPTATPTSAPTVTPVGPTQTPMATPTRTPTPTPLPPTPTATPTATSPSQVTLMVSPERREVEHIRGGDSCPMEIGDFRFMQTGGSGSVTLRRVGTLPSWLSLTQVGGGSSLPITLNADFTCQGVPAGEPDLRIEIQFEAVSNGSVVDTESIEVVVHVRSSGA